MRPIGTHRPCPTTTMGNHHYHHIYTCSIIIIILVAWILLVGLWTKTWRRRMDPHPSIGPYSDTRFLLGASRIVGPPSGGWPDQSTPTQHQPSQMIPIPQLSAYYYYKAIALRTFNFYRTLLPVCSCRDGRTGCGCHRILPIRFVGQHLTFFFVNAKFASSEKMPRLDLKLFPFLLSFSSLFFIYIPLVLSLARSFFSCIFFLVFTFHRVLDNFTHRL